MDLQKITKQAMDVGYSVDSVNLPRSCSISRTTGETYDPETDTYSGDTTTTYSFSAFRKEYSLYFVDGTVVQAGDARLTASQLDLMVEPIDSEKVTVDGVDWTIISHGEDSASTTWFLQIRR